MRLLTIKDGYIISDFVKIDDAEAEVQKTSLKHIPINNHTVAGNKGKKKVSIIPWKYFSVLSSIQKSTEQLCICLTFKTADLQDIFYTILGDGNEVNFDKFVLFVPKFITDAQTQIRFFEFYHK